MTFKIEAGKRYVAINGVVTGPLIPAYTAGKFKCPDRSIRQLHGVENSQVWNSDGTVYQMEEGESEHGLIAEYVDVASGEKEMPPPFPSNDLNDIVDSGCYTVKGSESNLPSFGRGGTVSVPYPVSSGHYLQYLLFGENRFCRYYINGFWSGWYRHNSSPEKIEDEKGRIHELECIVSSLYRDVLMEKERCKETMDKLDKARVDASEWKAKFMSKDIELRNKTSSGCSPFVPGRHPKAFVFDAYRSFANGGTVGALSGDAERTLDKRIDNAFTAINRLNREINDERSSTNARALFFGALAGAIVVSVAFGAHFTL